MSDRFIRIGNCSGFYGDKLSAAKDMVEGGKIDVLTGDYLAELTMAILFNQKLKRGERAGYVGTFLKQLKEVAKTCSEKNIKIVTNAGGLNPKSMAEDAIDIIESLGLGLKVAYIEGDDLMPKLEEIKDSGEKFKNLDTGIDIAKQGLPIVSANAYLGCWGIKKALDQGADIVICPRVTDAALVMGPAAWKYDWNHDDYDQLAGSLAAGHIIECGAQATGGNYSFFKEIPTFRNIGYPIAEIYEDGSFNITKHDDTGGLVSKGTVTAQLLYEIASPQYLNPDVTGHFNTLEISEVDKNKVHVKNVKGSPPPEKLKACINLAGGYKNGMELIITGLDIEEKAKIFTDELFHSLGGVEQFDDVSVQLYRTDKPNPISNEEAMAALSINVKSKDPEKVGRIFSAKIVELALANYPGWTTQSDISQGAPFISYWPSLVSRKHVQEVVHMGSKSFQIQNSTHENVSLPEVKEFAPKQTQFEELIQIEFGRVYGTRSGDKGGCANLGVWAKNLESYEYLYAYLTLEKFKELLPDLKGYNVERFEFPNIWSLNFYVHGLLENGVSSNNRKDGQAKSLGEYLGAKIIDFPKSLTK